MTPVITTEVSTLGDLLLRSAARYPDRLALVLPSVTATFAQLRDGAFRVARALHGMGIRRGEHVALLIPNSIEFAEALFGTMLAGCVAVPLNARHRAAELGFIIANAEAAALLTSRHDDDPVDFLTIIDEAIPSADAAPMLRRIALIRGEGRGAVLGRDDFLRHADYVGTAEIEHVRRSVRLRDPAMIIYTSGTTANPKGCVLPHEAVTRGPVERARHRLSAGGHDVTWAAGPLFHIGSLAPFVGSIGVAGTFLCDTYFEPGRAIALMADHGVTLAWPWFSAIVQGIIDHPDFSAEKFATLRHLFIIAPPTLVDRVQDLLPHAEILQACGMTETAGVFALCGAEESRESRSHTHGKAAPGIDIRIVDPDSGADLPDGTMGEILVRGYNVMDSYWAAPEKTREALDGGWLHTGDLYTRLPGGSLVFGGRCKDMLKVGGENVAAIEVEAFLSTHPAVKTAEVVGRPDARLDEVPIAFVELYPDHDVDEEALIAHCRGRIASYKVPRAIHFMSTADWPMSATKIDKRALRQLLG
ncbi:MAG: acyl--CoA ligase [Rhizorhabdus sp.]|uniref:class I adenylate-forming enzyme family protein n=1 Tax=Rhizorhabdus sp. TaxID=1968843 RepID=UPI001B6857A7|nr:class I adenylate-forming enzyme family protein [Rhizorhabdus sp.]MBP8232160.1 acyl--CoA ligase [Rhizorhabdus sp.]